MTGRLVPPEPAASVASILRNVLVVKPTGCMENLPLGYLNE